MRIECKNCGGAHPSWDCKRPAKKSTAARIERAEAAGELQIAQSPNGAPIDARLKRRKAKQQVTSVDDPPSQALPVDTNGKEKDHRDHSEQGLGTGRNASAGAIPASSASKFDKGAYQARYMREVYRPRLKAKKEAMKLASPKPL